MKVITLCGSTKLKKEFEQANRYLTLKGNIVFSLAFFEQSEGIEITKEQAELFEEIHFRKIDMSDEIFVIDVGGYIGSSTRKEIEYAIENGKIIKFFSKSELVKHDKSNELNPK
ncbi:hypothetical protein ACFW1P_02780 [Paenibacillus sp. NPDC058910]|uniref:hypothetical protein n=1 Tax=unclassified Paenibacillus TaxID=185978 RepID=UPI00368CB0EE